MTRFEELLTKTPPVTTAIIVLCTLLYLVVQVGLDVSPLRLSLCPRLVLRDHQYFRILTSTLFHGSLMHILMNMLSTYSIGSGLEKLMGTLRLGVTVILSAVLTGGIYLLLALLLETGLGSHKLMNQHSIGFSGVLFHLSVLECNLDTRGSRSIFGFFSVPNSLYPWVLLVLLQMFMPNLSMAGHLSGIMLGHLQLLGLLNYVMPSETTLHQMETWNSLQPLSLRPSFIPTTVLVFGSVSFRSDVGRTANSFLATPCHRVLQKVRVVIFGQGSDGNENIRLSLTPENTDEDAQPIDSATTSEMV